MEEWTQTDGYRVKAIKIGNATVYIKRPVLSEIEYQRREKVAQNALESYGRTVK